jgi:hypothetical protein
MRRVLIAVAVVGAAVAGREPARACSVHYPPEFVGRSPFASDAEIRLRVGSWDRSRRLELWDAEGRSVPSAVEVHTIPAAYRRNGVYIALKPLAPLAPGDHTLRLSRAPGPGIDPSAPGRAWNLTVLPNGIRPSPPAVRRLRARPVDYRCVTGLDAACQPVEEACGFVALTFEDGVRDERDVYEISWKLDGRGKGVPTRGETVRGFVSERTARGGGISIPVGWFGNLDGATGRVSIQLRALDDAGHAGRSASVSLPVAALRALPRLRRER